MTNPNMQVAGFRAAKTRKVQQLDEQVRNGSITKAQAAGRKSQVTRETNRKIAQVSA